MLYNLQHLNKIFGHIENSLDCDFAKPVAKPVAKLHLKLCTS